MFLLIQAIRQNDHQAALNLIHHAAASQLNQRDSSGQAPLHLAVQKNCPHIVLALLKKGVNINILGKDPGYSCMTPLHYAALTGNITLTKLLLAWGANPSLKNAHSHTAAFIAYQHGFVELARTIERITFQRKSDTALPAPYQQTLNQSYHQKNLELQNSSVENLQARCWVAKKTKALNNVVDFVEYKKNKRS